MARRTKSSRSRRLLCLVWGSLAVSCGAKAGKAPEPPAVPAPSPAALPSAKAASELPSDPDPWEAMNRKIFWFNDHVDIYVLEPAARGWDWVAPDAVQRSVSSFFQNLRFPIVTANDLLQGKVQAAASDVGRFVVNTTAGVAGFFDPAESLGLEPNAEDFGQTLGRWGLPPGPYLVIPLLGPSNPRDAVGLVADVPLGVVAFFVDSTILLGARVGEVVNERSLFLKEIEDAKAASLDYYVFVRNAYFQRRKALVNDAKEVAREDEEELYFPEEE